MTILDNRAEYLSRRRVPQFVDERYDLSKFRYARPECNAEFRHPWHTSRDLVITAGSYDFEEIQEGLLNQIVRALKINRAAVPDAAIVFILINSRGVEILGQRLAGLNVTLEAVNVSSNVSLPVAGAAFRYSLAQQYLERHRGAFDRVIFGDSRDVVMFTDAFGMVDTGSVHFVLEYESANDKRCNRLGDSYALSTWIEQHYPPDEHARLVKLNPPCVNCGIFFGGFEQVLEALRVVSAELREVAARVPLQWGVDTAVFEHLFYSNGFKHIPQRVHRCDNFVCFNSADIVYSPGRKILFSVKNHRMACSPVLVHQSRGF